MSDGSRNDELKKIISNLLKSYKDSGGTWTSLSLQTGIAERVLMRYVSGESSPSSKNIRSLLSGLQIGPESTKSILWEYFNVEYHQSDLEDGKEFTKIIAKDMDSLLIFALCSAKKGATFERICDYVPALSAKSKINNFLNNALIREVNGRYFSRNFAISNPKDQIDINNHISKLTIEYQQKEVTKAMAQVWGWSETGLEKLMVEIDIFNKKISEMRKDDSMAGDIPTLFNLNMFSICREPI